MGIPRSLRLRLLAVTLAGLLLALLLAGFTLAGLFRDHVLQQFETSLIRHLDQLTGQLEFDSAGQPTIDPALLSDPRWLSPYSGLYWQVDAMSADGRERHGVLRSRSLWDTALALHPDELADGAVHVHESIGPRGSPLLVVERTVRPATGPGLRWRLIVAADLQEMQTATGEFNRVLALSLGALLLLLSLAAWAQLAVGLKPLRLLGKSLQDLRQARTQRLQGEFPLEIRPLVDDFNSVLDHNDEVVSRARTHAGNLAHALKTPLTVMQQAAQAASPDLAPIVNEQVRIAKRHVDWHLSRARMAATQHLPGQRTDVAPILEGLVRVLKRVHAERGVAIAITLPSHPVFFAGEAQDLQEMLGNLLDNACKWAHSSVTVRVDPASGDGPPRFRIRIEDDGPGIDAENLQQAMRRGVRLDESVPGSGLGLAIVSDLVESYGGSFDLASREGAGLNVTLALPAAD